MLSVRGSAAVDGDAERHVLHAVELAVDLGPSLRQFLQRTAIVDCDDGQALTGEGLMELRQLGRSRDTLGYSPPK